MKTPTLKEFNRAKAKIERFLQRKQRSEGALEETLKTMRRKHKCKTVKQAQQRLAEIENEREEKTKLLRKEYATFNRDYKRFLATYESSDESTAE